MRRLLAACATLAIACAPKVFGDEQSTSPYATAADFAKYAMKLRSRPCSKSSRKFLSDQLASAVQRYPWKTSIVTTVFWVGEQAGGNNRSKLQKFLDFNWSENYAEPILRFQRTAQLHPNCFYSQAKPLLLCFTVHDVTHGQFKPEAPLVIPWFKHEYRGRGSRYAEIDGLPFVRQSHLLCAMGRLRSVSHDHFQYVFGNERPKPNLNHGAGLDVSPAVRDYLGLAPTDVTDWQFVEVRDVSSGPWRSYGENNHFVIARRQNEQRMADRGLGAAKK